MLRLGLVIRVATSQLVTRSSRHKPAWYKVTGRGPKFSGHADINDHYQRAKFACLRSLREIEVGG